MSGVIRRESKPQWAWRVALAGCLLLGALPFVLLSTLPSQSDERGRLLLFFAIALWMVLVGIATVRILKWLRPDGLAASSVVFSPFERALNWFGVLLALGTLYVVMVARRPMPLWLWGCCAALVAVLTIMALRSLPPEHRRRIAPTVYGEVTGLCVLFPVAAMPQAFRLIVWTLLAAVMIAMVLLMVAANAKLRASAEAAKTQASQ